MMIKGFAIACVLLFAVVQGSWMSCPVSFNPNPQRGINHKAPCEANLLNTAASRTMLKAGERIKVGWPSNNQGGGYVRLALVPLAERLNAEIYDRNVLKITCFGHDGRKNRYYDGYCHHPCNGRGGCEYQKQANDTSRYDTTVEIPTNLPDGDYVLQWKGVAADNIKPSFSCALLHISGGKPEQNCDFSPNFHAPDCVTAKEGLLKEEFLEGSSMGAFCFSGDSNDVDNSMGVKPINVGCDPRQTCELAIEPGVCGKEMRNPPNPRIPFISCRDQDGEKGTKDVLITHGRSEGKTKNGMLAMKAADSRTIPQDLVSSPSLSPFTTQGVSDLPNFYEKLLLHPYQESLSGCSKDGYDGQVCRDHDRLINRYLHASHKEGKIKEHLKRVGAVKLGPCTVIEHQKSRCVGNAQMAICLEKYWWMIPCKTGSTCKDDQCHTLVDLMKEHFYDGREPSVSTNSSFSFDPSVALDNPVEIPLRAETRVCINKYVMQKCHLEQCSYYACPPNWECQSGECLNAQQSVIKSWTVIKTKITNTKRRKLEEALKRSGAIKVGRCMTEFNEDTCMGDTQYLKCLYGRWWLLPCQSDTVCMHGHCFKLDDLSGAPHRTFSNSSVLFENPRYNDGGRIPPNQKAVLPIPEMRDFIAKAPSTGIATQKHLERKAQIAELRGRKTSECEMCATSEDD